MLIVPYACAEFHDKSGAVIHRIRPEDLRIVSEAPEAIRQDPLFEMMVSDGTLKVPESKAELKKLENDPGMFIPSEKALEAEKNGSAAPADEKKSGRKSAENK